MAKPFTASPKWNRCIEFSFNGRPPITVKVQGVGDEAARADRDALVTVLGAKGVHIEYPQTAPVSTKGKNMTLKGGR